jgi:hypothetical protein
MDAIMIVELKIQDANKITQNMSNIHNNTSKNYNVKSRSNKNKESIFF